jgi:DNA-binding NarL/FixJ family response regulator
VSYEALIEPIEPSAFRPSVLRFTTGPSTINRPAPIGVAIVEDDAGIRDSLAALVRGTMGFQCVGKYSNPQLALRELPKNWPDVVILDINDSDQEGLDCVAKLKLQRPKLQILIFTVLEDSNEILKSFMAGASGYLTDSLSARELEVLTHLAKGYRYKEIADALSISALTVRSHLQKIYEKLQVHSRTEAVVKFLASN